MPGTMRRTSLSDNRGKLRERRCAASGETKPEEALIRLAIAPDGGLVPDLAAKLPGRGVWVTADRSSIERAVKTGGLARSAKCKIGVPDGLADQIEGLLEQRALSLLGLARRAGMLASGFDAAKLALKAGKPAWRIEALEASSDGRTKLDRLCQAAWGDVPVAGCFSATALGAAIGRDSMVHATLAKGSQARAFAGVMDRLSGFRAIDPGGQAHEKC